MSVSDIRWVFWALIFFYLTHYIQPKLNPQIPNYSIFKQGRVHEKISYKLIFIVFTSSISKIDEFSEYS